MIHSIEFDVFIKDVDVLGIVFHPRFLDWAASGREKLFRDLKLDFYYLEELGVHFATKEISVEFKKSVTLGEKIKIYTSYTALREDRMKFSQKIYNDQNFQVANLWGTSIAIESKTKKIAKIPKIILQKLELYAEN